MGQVLNTNDFASARAVRESKLGELGVAPISLKPGQSDPGHSHTVVEEVVVVLSGEGQAQIEDQTYDLCAGSVVVIPEGQFHAYCNVGDENFEAIAIFNSNYDADKVVLKTREQHFGSESEGDVSALQAEIASLKKSIKKLEKQLKK